MTNKKLTKEQAAIIGAYTGITCGSFSDIHKLAEELLKRPIFTHEFASKVLNDELKEKVKPMFLGLCHDGEAEEVPEDNIKIQPKPVVDNKIETNNKVDKGYDKGWHDGVNFAKICQKNVAENLRKKLYDLGWSDMSKLEPKIKIKEERVKPVSIWKHVSELPRNRAENPNGAAVFYERDGQTFIAEAHTFYQDFNWINKAR